MTEEERSLKIVAKMDKLMATRKEFGMLLVDLQETGVQMKAIGEALAESPSALTLTSDKETLTTPPDGDGQVERMGIPELALLGDKIARLSTLGQEIARVEHYLREAGYGDFIQKA